MNVIQAWMGFAIVVAGALFLVPSGQAASGGPDGPGLGFGYVWVDRVTLPVYQWMSIASSGTALNPVENGAASAITFAPGFTFNFYGAPQTQVHVVNNGFATFGGPPGAPEAVPGTIPSGLDPNNMFAPFWVTHRLDCNANPTIPNVGNIYHQTTGTGPQRVLTVQWNALPVGRLGDNCSDNRNTFQLKLYEGTDIAEFHYLDVTSYGYTYIPGGGWSATCNQARAGIEGGPAPTGILQGTATGCNPNWLNYLNVGYRYFKDDFPNAQDQALSTGVGTPLGITLLVNNDPLEYTLLAAPSNGALAGFPAASTIYRWGIQPVTYTPNAGFCGTDTFRYKADDGRNSNWANVTITIPCPGGPNSVADTYAGVEDTPLTVAAPGVLANDSHPNGLPMTVALVSGPAPTQGSVVLGSAGGFTFTPAPDFCGPATFTYRASDGSATGAVTLVTINVACVNDAPTLTPGAVVSVPEDAPMQNLAWGTGLGTVESGQTLTATIVALDPSLFQTQPSYSLAGTLSFRPAPDAYGTTTATLTLQDSGGTANGGQDTRVLSVPIEIRPVNDAPSFSVAALASVLHDAGPVSVPGFATGFSRGPANEGAQVLTMSASADTPALFATQPALGLSGTLTFTPQLGQQGTAIVTATLRDDGGTADGGIDTATRTFAIRVVVPPTAGNDHYTLFQDTSANPLAVLANDNDPHGDPLTVVAIGFPTGTLVPGGPAFLYTPPPGFVGTTSFDYEVSDPLGGTHTATVTIDVQAKPAPQVTVTALQGERCAGVALSFQGVAFAPGRTPATWTWTSGALTDVQATSATTSTSALRPTAPGVHAIQVVVDFTDGASATGSTTQSLVPCPYPVAEFAVGGILHTDVTFLQRSVDAVAYTWAFGDGTQSAEPAPVHRYPGPGRYVVRLTVTAANGLQDTFDAEVTIAPFVALPGLVHPVDAPEPSAAALPPAPVNQPPTARPTALPARAGQTVFLEASGSFDPDQDPLTFSWTQHEGPPVAILGADQERAAFVAPQGATQLVFLLTVSDGMAVDRAFVTVPVAAEPEVGMVAQWGAAGFTFSALGAGPGARITWDFGDGTSSNEAAPTHAYAQPGIYLVRVLIEDDAGVRETSQAVAVAAPGQAVPQDISAQAPVRASIGSQGVAGLAVVAGVALLLLGATVAAVLLRRRT